MKEIGDFNKWKNSLCSWMGRPNIVKMLVLPNLIYKFKVFPIKTTSYFRNIKELIIKFIWKG